MRPTYTEFLDMDIAEARAWAENLPLLDDGTGRMLRNVLTALAGSR